MPIVRKWTEPYISENVLPWRRAFGNQWWYNPQTGRDEPMTDTDFWEMSRADVSSAYERDRNIFITQPSNGHWGPVLFSESGNGPTLPVLRFDFPEYRVSNKDAWAKAKLPGSIEIVVSSFERGFCEIHQGLGSRDKRDLGPDIILNQTVSALGSPAGSYALYKGKHFRDGQAWVAPTRRVSATLDVTPADLGFPFDDIQHWMLETYPFLAAERDIVSNNLADANRGMVDLLTSLAESPELIASIYNGCKTILRMYKDARKRNFRFLDKAAKVRIRIDEVNRSARLSKSERATRIRTLELQIRQLLDAAANVWLQYRLSILPTAITVEEGLKALDLLDSRFIRYRDKVTRTTSPPPDVLGWELSGDTSYDFRAFIKRGAKPEEMTAQLFSKNLHLTAWELVPLTFVLDRYVGIGNFLAALSPRNPKVTQGATNSWLCNGTFSYVHKATGASVTYKPSFYRRSVINPNDYICVDFPESRTRDQTLDHLALSWTIFLRNLKV